MTIIKPICTHCGGSEIHLDATASWDMKRQEWTLTDTMDTGYCADCEDECHWEFVNADAVEG